MNEILSKIKTPAYVCEEAKVRGNLEILKRVKDESGAKVLVALKGFAFSGVMELVGEYLDGATCRACTRLNLPQNTLEARFTRIRRHLKTRT